MIPKCLKIHFYTCYIKYGHLSFELNMSIIKHTPRNEKRNADQHVGCFTSYSHMKIVEGEQFIYGSYVCYYPAKSKQ